MDDFCFSPRSIGSAQVHPSSPGRQTIPLRMSRRIGGRDTLGLEDFGVEHLFGYCLLADCEGGSGAKAWLSGWQPSAYFEYPVALLPPGPVTLVACAADVFKGVLVVAKDCETETVQVSHSLEEPASGCLLCASDAEVSSPWSALRCLLSSVSTCHGVDGEGLEADWFAVEQALVKAGALVRESSTLGSGLLSSVLRAVDLVLRLGPRSASLLREAMSLLRLGVYRIEDAAAGDPETMEELASLAMQSVTRASILHGELQAAEATSANDPRVVDSSGCNFNFAASAADTSKKAAALVLGSMTIGTVKVLASDDFRLALISVDVNGESANQKFTLRSPSDGGGGSKRRRRRRNGLRRTLLSVASDAAPEVDLPAGLVDACRASPRELCPQPMAVEISYTRDAAFLLSGLGRAGFLSAAAEFAGVEEQGLSVSLVSGMLGLRIPSLGSRQSGLESLLNVSAALHFPLDGQVRLGGGVEKPRCTSMREVDRDRGEEGREGRIFAYVECRLRATYLQGSGLRDLGVGLMVLYNLIP